jgi:hypothetical protein
VKTITIRDWAHPVRPVDTSKIYAVVKAGDTLSAMAARVFGSAAAWPALWYQNRAAVRNPDAITAGQVLMVDAGSVVTPQIRLAALRALPKPLPPRAPTIVEVSSVHSNASPAFVGSPVVSTAGMGSFESCVITRESGGQAQVMNSSGHYGLFQFDYGTWVSGGGIGADFGHASAAEQDRVFASVYAARGAEPWSPSDGC